MFGARVAPAPVFRRVYPQWALGIEPCPPLILALLVLTSRSLIVSFLTSSLLTFVSPEGVFFLVVISLSFLN